MSKDVRAQSLAQLKWSLQALALTAEVQQRLFPSFACAADELALDFDHWCGIAAQQHEFTPNQLAALASVDALLTEMGRENNADLWTRSGLAQHPQWQEVRKRAHEALRTFQWTLEIPPSDRAIFVR